MTGTRRGRVAVVAKLVVCTGMAACSSSVTHATSREVISPVTDQYVWVIECDVRPEACEQEAKRVCPHGHRTLEGGRESWYADDEEPFEAQMAPKERKNYKRVGWTIACS